MKQRRGWSSRNWSVSRNCECREIVFERVQLHDAVSVVLCFLLEDSDIHNATQAVRVRVVNKQQCDRGTTRREILTRWGRRCCLRGSGDLV
jgi:hypothetical protein